MGALVPARAANLRRARRHHRSGHLFQNRFKSPLVQDDPYRRQLLAYVHLNPVRSRRPVPLDSLDQSPWTGHVV